MQEDLERDAAEEEQRGDQEDKARGVLAEERQVAQGRHLEGQQQRHEVHGGDQEDRVSRLAALRPLEAAELGADLGCRGFRDHLWLLRAAGSLLAQVVQHRLAQILICDEKADDDIAQEATEVDVHLARYRVRLGVVEGVEEIRQQVEILTAIADLLHRRVSE